MLYALKISADAADRIGAFGFAAFLDTMLAIASEINPPYSSEEALIIGDAIGIDFATAAFNLDAFKAGLKVEMEHSVDPQTDVIGANRLSLGRIVWAHLKEDPKYYDKLSKIES